jgi:hypothetical protein
MLGFSPSSKFFDDIHASLAAIKALRSSIKTRHTDEKYLLPASIYLFE